MFVLGFYNNSYGDGTPLKTVGACFSMVDPNTGPTLAKHFLLKRADFPELAQCFWQRFEELSKGAVALPANLKHVKVKDEDNAQATVPASAARGIRRPPVHATC